MWHLIILFTLFFLLLIYAKIELRWYRQRADERRQEGLKRQDRLAAKRLAAACEMARLKHVRRSQIRNGGA